jgi:hypothetical protein
MQIARRGFPGRLNGYPIFRDFARRLTESWTRRLDDVVDRIKAGELILRDDPMSRALRLFQHRVGLGVPCDLLPQVQAFSRRDRRRTNRTGQPAIQARI